MEKQVYLINASAYCMASIIEATDVVATVPNHHAKERGIWGELMSRLHSNYSGYGYQSYLSRTQPSLDSSTHQHP